MFETPLPEIADERDKHAAATQQPARQQTPPTSAVAKVDLMALALSRFGEWRAGAAALVERYRAVAFDLSTPKGYAELTKAIAEVRAPRFAAQNVSKASKSELAGISKAIGAEEAAVAAYLADTEARLVKLRDDHDAKVAADKAEAARILAERQQKQAEGVAGIRGYLSRAQTTADMTAERVGNGIKMLEAMTFAAADWLDPVAAASAQCETLEGLRALQATLKAREEAAAAAEAQRLKNERVAAELAEQRRKADAEQARIAGCMARIAEIRAAATGHEKATAADLYEARVAVAALDTSESVYQEFAMLANATQLATMAVLDKFHMEAEARELAAVRATLTPAPAPYTPPPFAGYAEHPIYNPEDPPPESTEGQEGQQVLKAEGESPDATDRATPANTSPRVGAMGAGQAADTAPAAEPLQAGTYPGAIHVDPETGDQSRITLVVSEPLPAPTLTLGKLNEWLAPLKIDAAGLELLGFTAVKVHNAKLYHDTDKAAMVAAMVKHLQGL
jgi:hypothetical protein